MSPENKVLLSERFYHTYAWIVLFAIGVVVAIPGMIHAIGVNTDPATAEAVLGMSLPELAESNPGIFELYAFYFRFGGLSDAGFGVLVAAIAATAYRNGSKSAWYTMLSVPVFFAASAALFYHYGLSPLPPLVFVLLALLGLFLPFRKFFPRNQDTEGPLDGRHAENA